MPDDEIEVTIAGAVRRGGRFRLRKPATIRDALRAAGGLVGQGTARSAGMLTVRRPAGWSEDWRGEVHRWDLQTAQEGAWWSFELEDRDAVLLGFRFRAAPAGSQDPAAEADLGSEPTLDGAFSPDGVDLTLIGWMLGLTPTERLRAAQEWTDDVAALRVPRED